MESPRPSTVRRRVAGWSGIVLLAGACLIVYPASRRQSLPAAFEGPLAANEPSNERAPRDAANSQRDASRAARRAAGRLRIGTFNIHHGAGPDGRVDLARTAAALEDLDLVGLQEVWGQRLGASQHQTAALATRLDMAGRFAPTERRWWLEHSGNAVLSALPASSTLRMPLPYERGRSPRNMLLTTVAWQGGSLRMVTTHLDRSDAGERRMQLAAVGALFQSLETPAVLVGDLNATRDDPAMQALLAQPGVIDAVWTARAALPDGQDPPTRIDHILTRGLQPVSAGIVDNGASDHPCVWVELEARPLVHSPGPTQSTGSTRPADPVRPLGQSR